MSEGSPPDNGWTVRSMKEIPPHTWKGRFCAGGYKRAQTCKGGEGTYRPFLTYYFNREGGGCMKRGVPPRVYRTVGQKEVLCGFLPSI